jgi:predicted ATP-grasp superfamily ATP-dependent carboligase
LASHPKKSVLVVGDDMRIFLSIVRSLGAAGIEVHAFPFDPEAPALKSRFISFVHLVPAFEQDQIAWRKALVNLLVKQPFDLVIPSGDPAIMALHVNRHELSQCLLAIPETAAIEALFDKEQTHLLCASLGIKSAKWGRLKDSDTSDSLINQFGLPLVIKPRRSFDGESGKLREKVEIIETGDELEICLASITDRTSFLVEGYFKGSGTGVSVLCERGTVLQSFQHRRLREGRGGCSSYRISEAANPELRHAVEQICTKLNHTGVCMFEFRVNQETGEWILLEVNARFWGSMQLPLSLGLDYPKLLFDLLVDGKSGPEMPYVIGFRSRNILLDANNLLQQFRRNGFVGFGNWCRDFLDFLTQPLRWVMGREKADSFSLTDMAPSFREILAALRHVLAPLRTKFKVNQ